MSSRWANGVVGLGALPACLLTAPDARAEASAAINPGPLISVVRSEETYFGFGGELSFIVYDRRGGAGESVGVGGFSQFQSYDGDFGRHAFGLQVGSFIGGELGYAYRESHGDIGGGHGLHAALYGSVGIAALSLRSTFPLVSAAQAGQEDPSVEVALCLALKIPIPIGDPLAIRLAHGRPLRTEGGMLLPDLYVDGQRSLSGGLEDPIARRFAEDARAEAASVPAFLRLATELDAHGARDLAARARAAAADEVRHARICLAIAGRRTRAQLSLGPTPTAHRVIPSLRELGDESLTDGWFGEGRAARELWERAASWGDPIEARRIASMALDEWRHADLGLDVALWAARSPV